MSGDIELGKCDFCRKDMPLRRIYLHGCEQTDKVDGFKIIFHCADCEPKEFTEMQKQIKALKEYVQHKPECHYKQDISLKKKGILPNLVPNCNCGLKQALK